MENTKTKHSVVISKIHHLSIHQRRRSIGSLPSSYWDAFKGPVREGKPKERAHLPYINSIFNGTKNSPGGAIISSTDDNDDVVDVETIMAHIYRVVQRNFNPEIESFYMLFERSLSNFSLSSLKQHIEYFNFRSEIQLEHPVIWSSSSSSSSSSRLFPNQTGDYRWMNVWRTDGRTGGLRRKEEKGDSRLSGQQTRATHSSPDFFLIEYFSIGEMTCMIIFCSWRGLLEVE